jgi:hypothetical protein
MVIQKCDQLQHENKNMFVLVVWTFPARFEFPFAYKVDSPENPFASISVYPDTNRPLIKDFAKIFVKHIEINWYQHFKTVQSILILQTYLKENNIPYLFTASDNNVYAYKDNEQLEPYWRIIDWDHWYMFPADTEPYKTTTPRGFYQWAIENKYPIGPDQHPLEQAHQDAVELIKGKFNELVKKSVEQTST